MRLRWLFLLVAGVLFALGCPDDTDDDDASDDDAEDDDTGDDDTGDDDTGDDDGGDDDTGDDDGGDDDTGDDDTGDDDTQGAPEIVSSYPHDGAQTFFHEHSIEVEFSWAPTNPNIVVEEVGGPSYPGTLTVDPSGTVVTFDPYDTSPKDHLLPDTDHTATITWDGHPDAMLSFRTATVGNPVKDPDNHIDGEDYWLDLSTATFVEPPGIGNLLGQYLVDTNLVMHVVDVDDNAGTAEAFGGYVEPDKPNWEQDLCFETMPLTQAQPGLWANPFIQTGPVDIVFGLKGLPLNMYDVMITGEFVPDGSQLEQGTFSGDIDTTALDPLVDPQGGLGATCLLLTSLGITCDPCPDGSGPYCIYLYAMDMVAPSVHVTGVDPQTGTPYTTLTEVTPQMLAAWQTGGYCP